MLRDLRLLFLVCFTAAVIPSCWAAPKCRMLIDKSRGSYPQTGTVSNFTTFESMLTSSGVVLAENTISPLTNLNYDGVGNLWIDVAYSNTNYTLDEAIAVYQFVRSGGSLLITLASSLDREASYPWIEQIMNQFYLHRQSVNLPTPTNQPSCEPIIAEPDHPLANGLVKGFTFNLLSAFGGGLTFLDTARELQPVFSFGNGSFYEKPIVVAGEFFPRGKVVIVWEGSVLDASVIQSAANLQFATNLVNYLKADCSNNGCQGKCRQNAATCFKDYCYCKPGFAGDTCNTDLQPCQYEGGCLPPQKQTPCSWVNPVRCPSGACTYSPSACPVKRQCTIGLTACANGSCALPQGCMSAAACPNVTCADGSCVADISDCEIIPFCDDSNSPFRCPDGKCAEDASKCAAAPSCPNAGEQLCMDGICRPQCPRYDGCRADTNPFQCSDYSCVKDSTACNTTCGGENTTVCWDGFCACTVSPVPQLTCAPCSQPASYFKPLSMTVFVPKDTDMIIPIVNKDEKGKREHLLSLVIAAGTFTDDVTLTVKEIATGNLRDEKIPNLVPGTLSSLVDLKISPSLPLQIPILLKFLISPPSQDLGADLFNASLTFLDESAFLWRPISVSTIEAEIPLLYTPAVQPGPDPVPPPPPKTLGGGTTHFTTFSVILGNGESADNGDGGSGDGDLGIILPAVLVPVGVGVVLMVVLGIVVGGVVVAWWQKAHLAGRGSVNFGGADNASYL